MSMSMSSLEDDDAEDDNKANALVRDFIFYFTLGALLFFAIPIRISVPQEEHAHTQRLFENFIINFNRTYDGNSTEYQRRYQIFKNSYELVDSLRQDNRSVFGINEFSDLSNNEFIQRYLINEQPYNGTKRKDEVSLESFYRYGLMNFDKGPTPLPESVDWRKRGIITAIRNQNGCGSCYAQSVIANVESMHALKRNFSAAEELSVQQMIDCAGNSNNGCEGGDTCQLLHTLHKTKMAVFPKRLYQLLGTKRACRYIKVLASRTRAIRVIEYTCFSFVGQEHEMLAFLAFKGPLIASVNALSWKHYVGGVIEGNCNGPSNHAIQIVGYDLNSNIEAPHFIVRNSWGTNFGHHGYAKVAIGGNVCGIAEEVSSVTVD